MRSIIVFCLVGLSFAGEMLSLQALVTRGPYLQKATPESIVIRWRSELAEVGVVRYGPAESDLPQIATELNLTTEHEVTLTGLSAETRYYYSVGNLIETSAGGPSYSFVTHPPAGSERPTRIWVIGDCGTFNTGAGKQLGVRDAYYNYTSNRYTDVWLALGDNAYYNGTDSDYQANFFGVYPALLRQTPLWSTIGNHETYAVAAGERIPYLDIFSFPEQGESGGLASGTEKYYSFDYASIHFVCLDSEQSDRTLEGPMLTWLKADLEANTSEWLIAFWHSPPYTKGSHNSDNLGDNFGNMTDMRRNAVLLLESHGVDLVLSGHSHIYERSYLIHGHYGFSSTLEPSMVKDAGSGRPEDTGAYLKPTSGPGANEGAVYVVAGSSGWATFRTGFHPIMYMDELETGSLVLDIDGSRLDAKFIRETGAIDDHFTINKGEPVVPLKLTRFQIKGGKAVVRWKSTAGKGYQVQEASDLELKDWNTVSPTIVASGTTTSWTNSAAASVGEIYYRVLEVGD